MKLPPNLRDWAVARQRHRLSHAHVQMARELGMNPRSFGKLDNHDQEPWKAPLPVFIEELYLKRFGRERPEQVRMLEETAKHQAATKAATKAAKDARRAAGAAASQPPGGRCT
jgi:hypothetical protein